MKDSNNAYGPWMLVSRLRGRGSGRGCASDPSRPGSQAAHAHPSDHDGDSPNVLIPYASSSRSPRGEASFSGREGHLVAQSCTPMHLLLRRPNFLLEIILLTIKIK